MKAVSKKLLSLMLVAILLVSAVPFQVSATETEPTTATEAAVEVAAVVEEEVEIEVTVPVAQEAVKPETTKVMVHFQLGSEYGNIQVGNIVSSKLGSCVSGVPYGSTAEKVLGQVIGSSTGYEFVRWYYETTGGEYKKFDSKVYLNTTNMVMENATDDDGNDYYVLNVFAEFHMAKETITLKPNGGSVKTTAHSVVVGETYDNLPTPSREHYDFLGWYKTGDVTETVIIEGETVVEDLTSLTAKWAKSQYTVSIERYADPDGIDASSWEEIASVTVSALDTLSVKYGTFVSEDDVELDGWSVEGWVVAKTGKTFVPGTTKIDQDGLVIRPIYKKNITLYACDEGNTTRKLTVTLGKNIGTLPNPGSREGYAFVGWYLEPEAETLISLKENLADVSSHPIYYPGMGNLYAGWDNSVMIYLYIHTDKDYREHTKLVRYYDAPANGFDLTEIDLGDIFASYGKYDDDGDIQHGWFSPSQWKNYCLNPDVFKNATTEYVSGEDLEQDDVHEFYIMLIDNGNNSSSSNSSASGAGSGYNDSSTVDTTNPATGDNIGLTFTVMTASAAALVLVFFLNKKRAIV